MDKKIILRCLAETLNQSIVELQQLDPDAPLLDVGMTSIRFISFIVKIEEEFQIEVLDSDLIFENFATLNKLYHTLAKYFPKSSTPTPMKKVLILDADNVLWKGICGEEPIVIDAEVKELQRFLLTLYEKGVLLCLCSKNHSELVDIAFEHSDMLLKQEHFAVFIANRRDKTSNLLEIAAQLNLSPDSFVFADDSDYELGFVACNLPEVATVKVALSDPTLCERLGGYFDRVKATSDLNRTKLYHEQKEREKEKHRFTTVQEYNASLKTQVDCRQATPSDCPRLAELSVRTHQFNLSDRQYSENELRALLDNQSHTVLSLSVRDKYGDMGIVGMAVRKGNIIEAFILSCRVFDRDLELVLLEKLKELSLAPLCGVYVKTDKNQGFADFYSNHGVTMI